jgi:agmatinase
VFGVDCPGSLREASQLVEPFDVNERKNLLEKVRIYDTGDIKLEEVESKVKEILSAKKIPLVLAKEHTVTLHAMKAMPAGTKLVVFDAHADLKDEYEGSRCSHACWLRRWCEIGGCDNAAIIGLRSCDEDEYNFMRDKGMIYFTVDNIRNGADDVKQRLRKFIGGPAGAAPVYVSVDMDVFDPSIAPAVKYAEPGGLTYKEFLSLLDALRGRKLAGLDCTEIRPLAGNMITELLAINVIFRMAEKFI